MDVGKAPKPLCEEEVSLYLTALLGRLNGIQHLKPSTGCLAHSKAAVTIACGEEEGGDDSGGSAGRVPRSLGSPRALPGMSRARAVSN